MEKYKKVYIRTINLKYQLQHRMKNFSYLMDDILYQISKTILNILLKRHWEKKGQSFNKNIENRKQSQV